MASRKTLTHILFAGLLAGSIFIGQAQAAPFTMVCKSGGNMKIKITSAAKSGHYYMLHFKKASKGSAERQPSPGQCAWTHRPLNNKEKASVRTKRIEKSRLSAEITAKGVVKLTHHRVPAGIHKLVKYVKTPNKVFSMVVSLNKGQLYFDKIH